ncbi:MAG: PAS domain-containing protein [Sedimentisphaerales bacterium]|nr:PAS domain-containing protein [Sedimentisphaerales bacterium]
MIETRCKILLVEDDELDQMAFKRFVEQSSLPYDCTIAGSFKEAQSILADRRFDIVVSDYMLGDGTAFDVLELAGSTPVVLVTGAGDQDVAVKAWKEGAYDYLVKDPDRNYLKTLPITVENAIRHSKTEEQVRLLSGAVMSTDDSVYITDMDGKIIFVNSAFCETYGYTEEEIIGQDSELLWMGTGQSDNLENTFQSGRASSSWGTGFYHKRKDQSVFPVSLSRSGIKDSKGNEVAAVGIARDVSELIFVENELRTANKELDERCRRSRELSVMALESLRRLLVEQQIDRARRVVEDFFTVAQIDAGEINLALSEFDFVLAVRRAVDSLSSFTAERGVALMSCLPDEELQISADYRRIDRTLRHLTKLAVLTARSDSHITIGVENTNSQIVVRIESDDVVIDSGQMESVFERSEWTLERITHEQNELTLGLPIAKEMIEMHGGCLWVESGDGTGNAMCFTLPKSRLRQESLIGSISSGQG